MRPSVEGERRVQLTGAAARVIARKGYEAATLRDVADEAGTSTGTLNYYYEGKDDLFAATLRAASERFQDELGAAVAAAGSPHGRSSSRWRERRRPRRATAREAHALWIDFWAQAARDESLRELNQRIYDRWRAEIAEIVRDGTGGRCVRTRGRSRGVRARLRGRDRRPRDARRAASAGSGPTRWRLPAAPTWMRRSAPAPISCT